MLWDTRAFIGATSILPKNIIEHFRLDFIIEKHCEIGLSIEYIWIKQYIYEIV